MTGWSPLFKFQIDILDKRCLSPCLSSDVHSTVPGKVESPASPCPGGWKCKRKVSARSFFFLRALSLACGWQPSPRTAFSLLMPKVTEDPATIACSPWKPLDSSVMSPMMQQPWPSSDGLKSWSSSNSSVLETCQPPSTFQPPSASLE
ncbi:PREDICTED: uncharacterized protein LOC105540031 [Mandrillus leucophaeus]|uniref:uncharacterized protein LOC105540031 n=1 Tax=Mandrillus leucophaeus TaxID=9568 RepID=UPI0005F51488|nr:PREDICTED: uncharacterized protein LOC105540031 [Mandrillus leucophaeus]